ncbi:MAG: glutamate 5-kinase [Syntrophales bacterium]|jgi:glutamate 5-kinase|nr:glutamate 5-kinase [Syntrophales bacterium]MDY0043413.1 glutamate 5-kinase [Syntrophales bacterium]
MAIERNDILKNARRILVKIGSGVLTTPDGIDRGIIKNLVDEIADLASKGLSFVMVSSGAIASGRSRIGFKGKFQSLPQKQAAAAIGQGNLMEIYSKSFGRHELIVAQILLTMSDLTNRQRYLNTRNTLGTLMDWKVIPIINENDTVSVDEIKFGDNDTLASMMANIMEANLLINLTNTEGLYDRNPHSDSSDAKLIPIVREITEEIEAAASSEADPVGMGGMKSKIMAARKVTAFGIPCIIAPGKKKGILHDIFNGKETGTLFLPSEEHMKSKKYWIAFTLRSRGKLYLDEGAVEAIIGKGKSLLPSGIIRTEGQFSIGDPVTCVDVKGNSIAKGLVNYSSADINRIKGLRTTRIEQVLGSKPYDEIIHRDNMAVTNRTKK